MIHVALFHATTPTKEPRIGCGTGLLNQHISKFDPVIFRKKIAGKIETKKAYKAAWVFGIHDKAAGYVNCVC
jgi:hypothetical protein